MDGTVCHRAPASMVERPPSLPSLSRMMRRATPVRRSACLTVLVLVCAMLLGACPNTESGTALYVTVNFDPALILTQIRIGGTVDGGRAFGPYDLPDPAERVLHSGETVRVLLPEAPDGASVQVYAEGMRERMALARGEGTAQVRAGQEVDLTLQLTPVGSMPPPDGGTPGEPDGGTPGEPDGGTGNPTCGGCTLGDQCTTPARNTCGRNGSACVDCGWLADRCNASGQCACGSGPPCSGRGVDRCEGGQCKCGSSSPCGWGQECVSGTCRCTTTSCASGCCKGDTCEPGTAKDACGTGGNACRNCNKRCNANGTCD